MSPLRRWLVWLGCAGTLILLAALFLGGVWAIRRGPSAEITLSDGTKLRFLGTTYGTNHLAPGGASLVSRLPRPVRFVCFRVFHWQTPARLTTPEPVLKAWFERSGPRAAARGRPFATAGPVLDLEMSVADATGFLVGGGVRWFNLLLGGGATFADLKAFPRRMTDFDLVVLQRNPGLASSTPLTRIRLRNPLGTTWPKWRGDPLPATQTNGNLQCILVSLQAGLGNGITFRGQPDGGSTVITDPAAEDEERHVGVVVRFAEDGQPTKDWTLASAELRDATGNHVESSSTSLALAEDGIHFLFAPSLWPAEVWEVGLWAKRTPEAAFSSDEVVELKGVRLPKTDEALKLGQEFQRGGLQLVFKQFVRRAAISDGSYSSRQLSELALTVSPLPEGSYVDVARVVDNRGRKSAPVSSSIGGTELTFGFRDIAADAETLDFTLAVHRGRKFVFRAQPELVRTNSPQPHRQTETGPR